MEIKDIRALSSVERTRLLAEKREELRAARFRVALAEEKRVRTIRELRTLIARLLTVARETENRKPETI